MTFAILLLDKLSYDDKLQSIMQSIRCSKFTEKWHQFIHSCMNGIIHTFMHYMNCPV